MPEWVWDPSKDALNRKNHQGLPLAAGVPVLEGDPLALSRPDPHPDGDRWQTVGSAGGIVVLFVVQHRTRRAGGRPRGRPHHQREEGDAARTEGI